ncbi:acetyltransferase [Salinispirillum sp. LH 10-3-1]|uniref:Acetyltransferase n=1 Tax=Salinispirillum sp. LH 10-3-1 TaxID=2952525 RepID=A0AB38YJE3_9GAMM
MSKVMIVGASGFGKEVAWLCKRLGRTVLGFLDDNPKLKDGSFYELPVLGSTSDWHQYEECEFVVAIGAPRVRKKIVESMRKLGKPQFATLIDPSAQIDCDVTVIGEGTVICSGAVCTADVKIGTHVVINKLCSIGHDVNICDYVTLAPMVMLGGHVEVQSGVEVGASAAVRQGCTLSVGSMIGMGSVVLKDTQVNEVVLGNPAKHYKWTEDFYA